MGEIALKPVVVYIPEDVDLASMTIVRVIKNEEGKMHNEIVTGCFTGRAEGYNLMINEEYALTDEGRWVLLNEVKDVEVTTEEYSEEENE